MEIIQHSHHQPRKKNSTRVNVIVSVVIHAIIFAAAAYWAAHEGVLGKKLQELSVGLLPKEKKVVEEKKPEPAKEVKNEVKQVVKEIAAPKAFVPPPPPTDTATAAAPPPVEAPVFTFDPEPASDKIGLYKQQVESILRARWDRPEGVNDSAFTAEVEMHLDGKGNISSYDWMKGSGNSKWDDSVKKALASAINRPPPKGFPDKFKVVFDVQPSEPLVSRAD